MKTMIYPEPTSALELFEPAPEHIYSLEQTAHLAQVPRRLIAVYFRHGLVSAVAEPDVEGWYFDNEAIRKLRQIEYLRTSLGMTLGAVKLALNLMHEVERLREEVRFLQQR